jgi:uncharacterized protein
MLRVDVRALRHGVAPTEATVAPDDPAFHGLEVTFAGPVTVAGELQAAGSGTFRWKGTVRGQVRGECRRCLAPVLSPFETAVEAVFTTDSDAADDPGVYRLTEPVTVVDLGHAVREEVALAAPAYPLCREDCAGLCPHCGADLNQGPCGCARSQLPV